MRLSHLRARLGGATLLLALLAPLAGCASTTSYVKSDATLGRVVVYRNGVAYFERTAVVEGDTLRLRVPADKVDDFLKSLTVTDATTGEPAPVSYPTDLPRAHDGLIDMDIRLGGKGPHKLRLSYVTEAPSWKPSYRVTLSPTGKVKLEAWAIVDNTSGEDWRAVKLGVGSSSALSFRFDLHGIRVVERETLRSNDLFAHAPPSGGAVHGEQPPARRVLAELSERALRTEVGVEEEKPRTASRAAPKKEATASIARPADHLAGAGVGRGHGAVAAAQPAPPPPPKDAEAERVVSLASTLRATKGSVVIEGFADEADGDKMAASLERANRARDQLLRQGVSPAQIVAVGRGEAAGKKGGVRVVEAPRAERPAADASAQQASEPASPIGTSHFESGAPMTVERGSSAMISILASEADGEIVYLYDAEGARGDARFPFRSVRLRNPTGSALDTGPVTVFGEGRFVGEGMADPIPAGAVAFVPFALDRQVVVDKKVDESDRIQRILTVQRGVFHTELRHSKKSVLSLTNRLAEKVVVYVKHAPPRGYSIVGDAKPSERLGEAQLFRVEVPASGKTDLVIEEATPVFRTTDLRSPEGLELIRVHVSGLAAEDPLRRRVDELVKLHTEMANVEQRIASQREQLAEMRARLDELHAQVVTLRAVRTTGPQLLSHLEKKLQEVSERVSKATVELVSLQERLMVAKVRFQDGVAELSQDRKDPPA
ncbi:MAG: DUF4139 domain-containing protein [Polyangiaceae bacterium]|nr:DUF4139 domain-containing protein [Polyangiaceae bacterium]